MNRRILVVDDERQSVRTFCDILTLHGWASTGAYSGEEALAELERSAFDAVLMDIRMPGMNGIDTFAAIRERYPELRVVLMTAFTDAALLEEAEREGSLAVLPKPVPFDRLLAVLDEAAENRGPILIVDDDPAFLVTLAAVLREHGYEALTAGSVDEALDRLRDSAPRIVLLDLLLRSEARKARDSVLAVRAISPLVAIILYSGQPALLEETVASLPSKWVTATLRKPFPPEQLLQLLDEALHD